MTEMVSYLFLQQYWWIIVHFLPAFWCSLMFVQGGQSMIYSLPQDDAKKTMIFKCTWQKNGIYIYHTGDLWWRFFCIFPAFLCISFGGAYWLWITILFSFIIQAIAYEYRSKPSNVLGKKNF